MLLNIFLLFLCRFFKDRHWLFTEFPELLGPESFDPKCSQNTNSEKTKREEFQEKEINLSRKCLENSHAVSNWDVSPLDLAATTNVVRSSCTSKETDCSLFDSVNEKLNSSSTESTEDNNLMSDRQHVEAFPGHQKKKQVFEVKDSFDNLKIKTLVDSLLSFRSLSTVRQT